MHIFVDPWPRVVTKQGQGDLKWQKIINIHVDGFRFHYLNVSNEQRTEIHVETVVSKQGWLY